MIISVCGPIGYETAKKTYDLNRETIQSRFAPFFVRQFEAVEEETVRGEPSSDETEIIFSCVIDEGGLYRALWEAGEFLKCGMKVAERAIPIRQEVIEILELFGESPYECSSKGSILVFTEKKVSGITISGKKVPAVMIGITTDDAARVIEDGETQRFLTPPARQKKDINDRISSGRQSILNV